MRSTIAGVQDDVLSIAKLMDMKARLGHLWVNDRLSCNTSSCRLQRTPRAINAEPMGNEVR